MCRETIRALQCILTAQNKKLYLHAEKAAKGMSFSPPHLPSEYN